MNVIQGDLITLAKTNYIDVIVHGCNCKHTMGAGIAKQIKRSFPLAYAADKKTLYMDRHKLGTYSYAVIGKYNLIVVNGYTQFDYSGKNNINYDALRKVFNAIKRNFSGKIIAFPKIGAGLAGGNWSIIKKIIDDELEGECYVNVVLPNNA
jgi:O-acetyl-ADP-ribose deacetylase (regulator of RNase III)